MSETGRIYPLRTQVMEPLWREVLGSRLRALRAERDETLAQTAERAGISPQYLSEIERGRKEASSEMIAALAGALGRTVAELMADAAEDLRRVAVDVIATSAIRSRTALGPSTSSTSSTPGAPSTTRLARSGQRPSGPVALAAAA